jgi:hypothetical protein
MPDAAFESPTQSVGVGNRRRVRGLEMPLQSISPRTIRRLAEQL